MNKLNVFLERLKKIGINMNLVSNYPWVYIDKINGNRVIEKYKSNHGFTITHQPIRMGDDINLAETEKIFELIRKYK